MTQANAPDYRAWLSEEQRQASDQRLERNRKIAQAPKTMGYLVADLIDESSLMRAQDAFNLARMPADNSFRMDRESLERIAGDLPLSYQLLVAGESRSANHADALAKQYRRDLQREERFRTMHGTSGAVARVGSMLLDPGDLAIGAAAFATASVTGGVSTGTYLLRKSNRVRRAWVFAAGLGAGEGLRTATEASIDPRLNEYDIIANSLLAGSVGFGIQRFADTRLLESYRKYYQYNVAKALEKTVAGDASGVNPETLRQSIELAIAGEYLRPNRVTGSTTVRVGRSPNPAEGVRGPLPGPAAPQTMTSDDYVISQIAGEHTYRPGVSIGQIRKEHAEAVKQAIARGENVSDEIVASAKDNLSGLNGRLPDLDKYNVPTSEVAWVREALSPEFQNRVAREAMQNLEAIPWLDKDTKAFYRAVSEMEDPKSFLSQVSGTKPRINRQSGLYAGLNAQGEWTLEGTEQLEIARPTSAVSKARISLSSSMERSQNPVVRWLGNTLVENTLAFAEGRLSIYSASEFAGMMTKRIEAQAAKSMRPIFARYAERQNKMRTPLLASEFNREVGRAVRLEGTAAFDDLPEDIRQAVAVYRGQMRDVVQIAKKYRVAGFENIEDRPGYLPRLYNREKMANLIAQHGEDRVVSLFAKAFRSSNPDLSEVDAGELAKGFVKRIREQRYTTSTGRHMGMTAGDRETLEEILRGELGLDNQYVESIMTSMQRRPEKADIPARARFRVDLDESAEITLADGSTLRFADLLENDAEMVVMGYTRELIGEAAMAEVYRGLAIKAQQELGLEAPPAIRRLDQVQEVLQRIASKRGIDPDVAKSDLRNVMTSMRSVLGMPMGGDPLTGELGKPNWVSQWLRRGRDYNAARLLGMSGFAQFLDFANSISTMGIQTTLDNLPAMAAFRRNALTGEIDNMAIAELEFMTGNGTFGLRNRATSRFDVFEPTSEQSGEVIDTLTRGARVAVMKYSGQAAITDAQQRLVMLGTMQNLAQHATARAAGKRGITVQRLAAMGLDEDMANRISQQLQKHAIAENLPGRSRIRIQHPNLSGWDDQQAAAKFVQALDKETRRLVQENDIGNLFRLMTTDVGRTVFQLRSFVVGAYEKQLLFNLGMRDQQAAAYFLYNLGLGAMVHMARVQVQSIGRADREKYLEEQLAPARIGAAAFALMGASSFLPQIADTALFAANQDPVFSYRMSGLATQGLLANPTADLFDSLPKAVRAFTRGAAEPFTEDTTFGQEDVESVMRLITNHPVIKLPVMLMTSGLPRRANED